MFGIAGQTSSNTRLCQVTRSVQIDPSKRQLMYNPYVIGSENVTWCNKHAIPGHTGAARINIKVAFGFSSG